MRTIFIRLTFLFALTSCWLLVSNNSIAQNSDALLSIFSESDVSSAGDFSFSQTTDLDLSGSNWGFRVDENDVYHAALRSNQTGPANRDWEIRIGQGGQIYSIRSEVGEIVPPQSLGRPFVDEVFQAISVDTSTRVNGDEAVFYHQSSYFPDGDNVDEPTFAPLLANGAVDSNSYSTLSLAVQADTTLTPQQPSGLLNYQRTRDLGDGVIEVTHSIYNFGDNRVDFHNLPWGGVRKTEFDNIIVSDPGGGFTDRDIVDFSETENQVVLADDTGGWAAFTEGTDGTDRGLAYVFGFDTHADEDWQTNPSSWRWGDGGEDLFGFIPIRNFNVGTFRRQVDIDPGDLFESRYYLVLGDVDHIESTIEERGLAEAAIYDKITIAQEDAEILNYQIDFTNGIYSIEETTSIELAHFATYATPVNGSQPLFLYEDIDGNEFISVDPYALSDFPYDGETQYQGILGFVLPTDLANQGGNFVDLNTLFPEAEYYLDTDPTSNFLALQGVAGVPEPSTAWLFILGSCVAGLRRGKR